MNRIVCGYENDPDAEFCENCASPLAQFCTNCGARLKPEAKFCKKCGSPLKNGSDCLGEDFDLWMVLGCQYTGFDAGSSKRLPIARRIM